MIGMCQEWKTLEVYVRKGTKNYMHIPYTQVRTYVPAGTKLPSSALHPPYSYTQQNNIHYCPIFLTISQSLFFPPVPMVKWDKWTLTYISK